MRYPRNSKDRPLRKDGDEALYNKGDSKPRRGVYARIEMNDRRRLDDICRNDGPMPIHAAIHELLQLYDFMLGKTSEPEWLARRQHLYKKRGEAT